MSSRIAPYVLGLVVGVAAGCGQPPVSPVSPNPSVPVPIVPSEPPQAVLRISPDPVAPLGFVGFTPFVFDASESTGEGLSYRIDFGDGEFAETSRATRVFDSVMNPQKARLTVTDRQGRTASAEQVYWIHPMASPWWIGRIDELSIPITFALKVNGSNISGTFCACGRPAAWYPLSGHLTGERDVVLRTDDGTMEMSGGLGWIEPPTQTPKSHLGIRLRLAIRGGPFDRTTVLASVHEPY